MDSIAAAVAVGSRRRNSLEGLLIFSRLTLFAVVVNNFRLSGRGMITMTLRPPQSERYIIKADVEGKISIQDNEH